MQLAVLATRFPTLYDGVRLFSSVAGQRVMGAGQSSFTGTPASEFRPRGDPQRREYRQPERQDDGKRGLRGFDAGKKVKGRKRHIVVDTQGLLLNVVVHSAGLQDPAGARLVLSQMATAFPRLSLIWADDIYKGPLVRWVWCCFGWRLQIVKRTDDRKGFQVLPQRWVVERTFAWLGRYRRLSKDYEALPSSSEAWIYMAMSCLMLHRLAPP